MDNAIILKNVGYTYNADGPNPTQALKNVSFTIPKGKTTAIIGHTGSGKSTLLRLFNVLLQPTQGEITINEKTVTPDTKPHNLKELRKKVGLVFQFPESQLFDETVLKDVMFGPLNYGASEAEAEEIARQKLKSVAFPEDLYDRSPFDLSGGQKRRAAIAGVMALEPEILVLDEPTAGLDPAGHKKMMEYFMEVKDRDGLTLVLVTHQMEDVAKYADQVIVMEKGSMIKKASPKEVFSDRNWLIDHQLSLPKSAEFYYQITKKLKLDKSGQTLPIDPQELAQKVLRLKEDIEKVGGIDV